MATTVIIPARNEEKTIGNIVAAFSSFPETYRHVYVAIDADTTDKTATETWYYNGVPLQTEARGKGQVVQAALRCIRGAAAADPYTVYSERIMLCDGDYTGLTTEHIAAMFTHQDGMTIGIPDWPADAVPEHVIKAWPRISGFRYLPVKLVPEDAHGYLLETQINLRAVKWKVKPYFKVLEGLRSPFTWPLPDQRMKELIRDRDWGRNHGIL